MPETSSRRSILRGRLVTVSGPVIDDGRLLLDGARIAAVLAPGDPWPSGWTGKEPSHDTGGTVYPGLIDLHGHLPYNILPLWQVPARFENRKDWRDDPGYGALVSQPMHALFAGGLANPLLGPLVRFIEVKLLLAGVCTAQGLRFREAYPVRLARGLVRNVEVSDPPEGLKGAASSIGDLDKTDNHEAQQHLAKGRLFIHLAEGVDGDAAQQFTLAERDGLLQSRLVCIHCLGLDPTQRARLHEVGITPVWSPLSNLLLYGQTWTPQPHTLGDYALGSDWSPTGSKNLLQELKVAWLWLSRDGGRPDLSALLRSVTLAPARALGWEAALGSLEAGKLADLLVLPGHTGDATLALVRATERQVRGVMIDGVWRHGDADWMAQVLEPHARTEALTVGGQAKTLNLHVAGSDLNDLRFGEARSRLTQAMGHLKALAKPVERFMAAPAAPPAIDLDMQAEDTGGLEAFTRGPKLPMPDAIPLDAATVVDDPGLFQALSTQRNLPGFLVPALRAMYAPG